MADQKILYFDCASGISGDMTLAALLDLGVDEKIFIGELEKLRLDGLRLEIAETQKNGIRAKRVRVLVDGAEADAVPGDAHGHTQFRDGAAMHGHTQFHENTEAHEHVHPHIHMHPHRSFADIRRMITQSALKACTKDLALRIFGRVAAAEARVHAKPIEEVHFHEVGAVDSIVDIVGCAILIDMIAPQAIYASVLCEGQGYVRCQHGLLSVPVPATSEILTAANAPLRQTDIDGELITPTGAAIIAELAQSFGPMPEMKMEKIGWGAGTKDLPVPNVLKICQGFASEEKAKGNVSAGEPGDCGGIMHDEITVLEANVDDCTGEMLGFAMEILMAEGALDVSYQPVFMKKNRPAYRLTVLVKPQDEQRMERLIFLHTTTIGIRKRREQRSILAREHVWAKTPYGEMRAKKVSAGKTVRLYPEYESAVKLALENDISLWEIYRSYEESE